METAPEESRRVSFNMRPGCREIARDRGEESPSAREVRLRRQQHRYHVSPTMPCLLLVNKYWQWNLSWSVLELSDVWLTKKKNLWTIVPTQMLLKGHTYLVQQSFLSFITPHISYPDNLPEQLEEEQAKKECELILQFGKLISNEELDEAIQEALPGM